jgi:CHAT domain-containing protein
MPGLAVNSNPMRSNLMVANLVSSRERALAVSATAGDKVGQAVNHIGLAQLLVEQGNFAQALSQIAEAEPALRTAGDPKLIINLLRIKAAAHMQAGEFEAAISDNARMLPMLVSLQDDRGRAEAYLSQAWADQSLGDIPHAIGAYESAAYLFALPHIADSDGQVRAKIGLGSLYQSLGQYAKASALYRAALPQASSSQKARIYASNADLLQAAGNSASALAHYAVAQKVLGSDSDPSLQIAVLTGMGRSLMSLRAYKDAEQSFAQALRLAEPTQNASGKAAILASMGELQYWLAISPRSVDPFPRFKQALKNYDAALPLMRAIGDRAGEIGILTNSGLVYDAEGKSKQALANYNQALEKMEQLQTQARLEEFRGNIADQSAALYARAIQLAVETHQQEAAFALSERARARLFLDQLGNAKVDDIKEAPVEFLSREAQLRKENITLERRLGQELSRSRTELNSENMSALQSNLAAVRASYERLMNDLKLSNPSYAAFLNVSPISLVEAQRQLDPSGTIVSFYTEPDETFAFIVTKTGLKIRRLEIGQAELTHEIATFRDFAGEDEVSPSLRVLYKALIAPIHSEFKTTRLVVVPHGVLHELPFAALTPDGHRFLSDDFSISYLPSVSALSYLHSKPVSSAPRALVLASDQEEGFPLLASANDEGQSVGAFFDTKLMLGKEATSAALRENGADYDILHLIAHFEIDRKNPMASRILLSRGEKGEESPLDLAGVYRLSLRKTDLVVLSGCQSQTGKRTRGDDIIGLSQAFLYAGSPSVVASLWSVDDDATKLLMVSFYSGLRRGTSKTDALRLAQIEVRRKYPSPFYWAAFVLNGDPGGHEAAPSVAAN